MQQPPTVGQLIDLPRALRELLRAYSPNGDGLNSINGCVIAFPVPNWAESSMFEQLNMASIGAGASATFTYRTVPQDERWWIDSIRIALASGDNTVLRLSLNLPTGYRNVTSGISLINFSAGTNALYWPDPGGIQANIDLQAPGPILAEPGSELLLLPAGAGASATVFTYYIQYRRMLIKRTLEPGE